MRLSIVAVTTDDPFALKIPVAYCNPSEDVQYGGAAVDVPQKSESFT